MHTSGKQAISLDLLKRHDRPGPRYTSYPTAVEFGSEVTAEGYAERLASADLRADEPLSLYVHLPFCEERCWYCGCNVVITKKREVAASYLAALEIEIDRVAALLPHRRRVSQLHWGGGTPTYLDLKQIEALQQRLLKRFELTPDAEVAIEVDPRVTTAAQVTLLRRLGFNRVSFGVQDFDAHVQEAIGRHQSDEQTRRLYGTCRELRFDSINFDLVYGLPLQTPERFADTAERVAALRPDRIAIYSYAHLPRAKPHQKRIDADDLPPAEVKLELFRIARQRLLDAGYEAIGMDHFALPGDELVHAMRRRSLQRNFMGYTVRMGTDMIGLGLSAIGDVSGCYVQNQRKLSTYKRDLEEGRLPVERGRALDADDEIRRAVIADMMCNFRVEPSRIEKRFGIGFESYFARELAELRAPGGLVDEEFVEVDAHGGIDVVGHGRLFVRNAAMVFDRYLRTARAGEPVFSRTV